ncbi:MAG: ADP-ribosylglycohydrolase family protein [Candidatus Glassbacteria bacterium]|nr:ADP-ribosylglycohydrolase family protein [Candidatus Glassbacteria bacterium]
MRLGKLLAVLTLACPLAAAAQMVELTDEQMLDKIKGGWVGQVVGCTYGGPTEFRWNGTWIQDYVPLRWDSEMMYEAYTDHPGLYDDIYMDLAFMAVLAEQGLDAPVNEMALKYANAGFTLWHANQAGRWNILNGIMPPASGHWKNNPHADDIDFQIESDFIGLINPGMPATALDYALKIGHIMNYGDGVYGGVFVSALYAHAFVENDIVTVVEKALLNLPEASRYRRCVEDVLGWWRNYPDDWKECWFQVQREYTDDVGCPAGALLPFNIDAVVNGAYIVIGLLYGQGDFGKTVDISTRCGFDSDCNPSNAGGVLGTMIGFGNIPAEWLAGLERVEDLKFSYSDYSLNDIYRVNLRLAEELVIEGGGEVQGGVWTIKVQQPKAPETLEVAFEGLEPASRRRLSHRLEKSWTTQFEGRGFVIDGRMLNNEGAARCQVKVDGEVIETLTLEGEYRYRRTPLFWYYDLEPGQHTLEITRQRGSGVPQLNQLLIYR